MQRNNSTNNWKWIQTVTNKSEFVNKTKKKGIVLPGPFTFGLKSHVFKIKRKIAPEIRFLFFS